MRRHPLLPLTLLVVLPDGGAGEALLVILCTSGGMMPRVRGRRRTL